MPRTLTDAPFLTGFAKRKPVLLKNDYVDSNLTGFPNYIKVNADADIAAELSSTHLAITLEDGETLAPHELLPSSTPASGTILAFFKTDRYRDTDSVVYLYYDDAGTDQEDPTNVWDGNFAAVYHMEQDPSGTAPQITDSTANNNDGTSEGTMTSGDLVAGTPTTLGNGLDFDGTDDRIQLPNNASLNITGDITIEAIVSADVIEVSTQTGYILGGHKNDNPPRNGYGLIVGAGGFERRLQYYQDATLANSGQFLSASTVYCLAVTASNTTADFYIDGSFAATASTNAPSSYSGNRYIAAPDSPSGAIDYWDGQIYELRISNTLRSAAWLKLTYRTLFDNANTFELGPEEENPVAVGPVIRSMLAFWMGGAVSVPIIAGGGGSTISIAGAIFGSTIVGAASNVSRGIGSSLSNSGIMSGSLYLDMKLRSQIYALSRIGGYAYNSMAGSGQIAGNSGVNGALYTSMAIRGQIDGRSAFSGICTVNKAMLASILSSAYLDNELNLLYGGRGGIDARSSMSAAARNSVGAAGSLRSQSVINGALSRSISIAGNIYGISIFGSVLTTGHDVSLGGSIASGSRFGANLGLSRGLNAALLGQSDLDGVLLVNKGLFGNVQGISALNGYVLVDRKIIAALEVDSSLNGILTVVSSNVDYDDHYFVLYLKSSDGINLYISSTNSFNLER